MFTSSSHLHILTCAHTHIFTSSNLHKLTPSHLRIFTSSHLLTFTSSHLHIFTSSHLHIFTSSHPHICASSHNFSLSLSRSSPSRLRIFTSSYLLSRSLSLSLCFSLSFSLSLSLSCALSRSLSFFFFSPLRPQALTTRHHDIATLSHEMRIECPKLMVFCIYSFGGNPFARNEARVSKTDVSLQFWQPFSTKRGSSVKNSGFFATLVCPAATL